MLGHLKLNYSPLNFFQLYSYTRLTASVINYQDPKMTNNRCRRSNPNLIFLRFRSDIEVPGEMLESIPKNFGITSTSKHSYFFPIKRAVAAKIAGIVMNTVREKRGKTNVIEVNPGPGLIAQELIKNNLKKLIVFDSLMCPYFTKWVSNYKKRIEIRALILSSKGFNMLDFSNNVNTGKHYTVIISLPRNRFLRVILYQIVFFDWNYYKNVVFYLVLSSDFYKSFYCGQGGTSKASDYGLCSILFDAEILEEFDCRDFFPTIETKDEKVYLVRFMRKAKCPLSKNETSLYYLFLLNVLTYKRRFIIQSAENWFPGIGPSLIANGVKVTNRVHEYTPDELMKLFLLIKELGWSYSSLEK